MILFTFSIFFLFFHIFLALKVNMKNKSKKDVFSTKEHKELCLLIPCYNEGIVITSILESLFCQTYPNLEIVFINDGSDDDTFDIIKKKLNLLKIDNKIGPLKTNSILGTYVSQTHKNIFVIDKANGGKADSLNAGINFTNKEYIITLDADSILKEDALFQINHSLQDKDVIAVGGNVVVAQGVSSYDGDIIESNTNCSLLESVQFLEYLRGFFIQKNSYSHMNALSVISGAFGVFKRDIMIKVNGYRNTIGEDIDITIKFNKYALQHKKTILYNDKAMCFTEVPNNFSDLAKQRIRWQKAFIDALKNHFSFFVKNFFKNTLSFFIVFEGTILMYTSTILTILGLFLIAYTKTITPELSLVLKLGTIMFILYNIITFLMISKTSISLKNINKAKLLIILLYEFIIFRSMIIVILLYATVEYFFKPNSWNKIKRIGTSHSTILNIEENIKVA